MKKNQVNLCDSFDLLVEASEHEMKYPSTAEDSSSTTRRVQYILTRVLNKLNNLIEVSDTQAVAGLVRFDAGQCSDIFWVYDSKSIENYMLDEICPKTETDKVSVRSEEESLSKNDSLKEFVVDGGGVDTVVDETNLSRPQRREVFDTEMGDAIDNSGEQSISASVYNMDGTEWLERTNEAEMLACEDSNDTTSMNQWSDLDSFDEGKGREKLDTQKGTKTSQVSSYHCVELKRDILNNTMLYVSSDKPIGVPNFNQNFCYIASSLQMLRDHTHGILSSPHEF